MLRLLTFGCSFIYGQGLPDCFEPPYFPSSVASKMGWPNMLATKLNRECVNLSSPGTGNLTILMKILETEYKHDDLVIIGYSFFDRFRCHRFLNKTDGEFHNISLHSELHKDLVRAESINPYIDQEYYWYNYLLFQHVELFLKSKNVRHYSFHNVYKSCQFPKPSKFINLENFWEDIHLVLNRDGLYTDMDLALDGAHPGIKSHALQAEMIYNKLKQYELH